MQKIDFSRFVPLRGLHYYYVHAVWAPEKPVIIKGFETLCKKYHSLPIFDMDLSDKAFYRFLDPTWQRNLEQLPCFCIANGKELLDIRILNDTQDLAFAEIYLQAYEDSLPELEQVLFECLAESPPSHELIAEPGIYLHRLTIPEKLIGQYISGHLFNTEDCFYWCPLKNTVFIINDQTLIKSL